MTLWFVPVALAVLSAVAAAVHAATGALTPARRHRRRVGRPSPYRRCALCWLPERNLPVVCLDNQCPEVTPIKMTFEEYLDISDHLK